MGAATGAKRHDDRSSLQQGSTRGFNEQTIWQAPTDLRVSVGQSVRPSSFRPQLIAGENRNATCLIVCCDARRDGERLTVPLNEQVIGLLIWRVSWSFMLMVFGR